MPDIVNPFDANGFNLATMTRSINKVANRYGRIGALGLFGAEPVTQRTVLIEETEGTLTLLPSQPLGAPATTGSGQRRKMRSFVIPHIPFDDVVWARDVEGVREFGTSSAVATLASVLKTKLERMRQKHAQTLEFMRLGALKGKLFDGAGVELYDYFAQFEIDQKSIDFDLGNPKSDVPQKIRTLKRYIDEAARGELIAGYRVMVSSEFFDALIIHPSVEKAYIQYQAAKGGNPLAEDLREGFTFHGVTFEEYNATFSLYTANKSTPNVKKAFEGLDDNVAFPTGTVDTFVDHYAPADLVQTVNTLGRPLYARQKTRQDERGFDILTESNPLPLNRRPEMSVRIFSSSAPAAS